MNNTTVTVTTPTTTTPSMETLELIVLRTDGALNANFDEIEAFLDQQMDGYRLVQYSDNADESIRQMRKDRSDLNKLVTSIKSTKKVVKDEFMVPLNQFNERADRLIALIEEPKMVIDEKIKELEEAGREAKRKAIREYYDSISARVDDDFKEELYRRLYNASWENATATQKAYKEGLKKGVDNFIYGMQCLKLSNHEFMEDGIREFKLNLDLSAAIKVMEDKQAQKEELLRKEQERLEEERRRIEEAAQAEAQRKIDEANKEAQRKIEEAQKKAEEEAQRKIEAQMQKVVAETEKTISDAVAKATAEIEKKAQTPQSFVAPSTTTVIDRSDRIQIQPQTLPHITVDEPVATDKVTVVFDKVEWELIQKYADRMGVKYAVKA